MNVSIIGAGAIAEEHIKVFLSLPNCKLVGIHSRTNSKALELKKKYKINEVYNSIEQMHDHSKSDLVIVAVSLESLYSVYKKVVCYDWICLLEKPVGLNPIEAKKIISICKYPEKIFISLNRYSYSTTSKLLRFLKKDKSKRIIYIFDQENIMHLKNNKIKKNWMYCNSIHLVDYCRFLVRGRLVKINLIHRENKLNFIKHLNFSSGDRVIFTSIWNKPGPWSIKIFTDKAFFNLFDLENLFISTKNFRGKKYSLSNVDRKFKPGFFQQAKELRNFFLYKTYPNVPNIMDAYRTMLLTRKIYETN